MYIQGINALVLVVCTCCNPWIDKSHLGMFNFNCSLEDAGAFGCGSVSSFISFISLSFILDAVNTAGLTFIAHTYSNIVILPYTFSL